MMEVEAYWRKNPTTSSDWQTLGGTGVGGSGGGGTKVNSTRWSLLGLTK